MSLSQLLSELYNIKSLIIQQQSHKHNKDDTKRLGLAKQSIDAAIYWLEK